MKAETKFTLSLKKKLDVIPNSVFIKIQMVALRGVPDYIGVVGGRFVGLEIKTETGKIDKLQTWWLDRLMKAGAYCWTVRPSNADEVLRELRALSDRI